jgi:hypothetical protein
MHNLILGKRNAGAMQRILTTSKLLAEKFQIDPALASSLKVQEKDPLVRALKEREAVANLLDAIASEMGLIKPESNEDPAEVPASVPGDDPLTTAETGEGLPAPVLDDADPEPVIEEKKTTRKKAN